VVYADIIPFDDWRCLGFATACGCAFGSNFRRVLKEIWTVYSSPTSSDWHATLKNKRREQAPWDGVFFGFRANGRSF
jgi:hypothetical protein